MKASRPPTVWGLWKCPENVGTLSGKADRGMPEWEETPSFIAAPLMSTWQNIALHPRDRPTQRDGVEEAASTTFLFRNWARTRST